jgi:ATP-binding cassette subfamily F protein uup
MEALILEAEEKLKAAEAEMHTLEGSSDRATVEKRYASLQSCQAEVERLYERWAELEAKLAS